MTAHTIDDVTCLGCGCACDDIRVSVQNERIVEARNACVLGRAWFGDGTIPSINRVDGREAPLSEALAEAADRLAGSAHPLVYLAPGISCEAQREAAGLADLLRARLDSTTSANALPFIVAAQERGLASATFGEIRNRADVILFWAIDVGDRYPRFESRYAPAPAGPAVPNGRRGRRVIAVDVGAATSTATDIDRRFAVSAQDEVAVLVALQGLLREPTPAGVSLAPADDGPGWSTGRELATELASGRYVAVVFDAEPDDRERRSRQRFDAILGLSHVLNQRSRCAAVALRGGGNRSGADTVLTSQTGYPLGIDFSRGYPRYRPLADGAVAPDVGVVIGDVSLLTPPEIGALRDASVIAIGPAASSTSLGTASVTIDTGVAGIHESGSAVRADDVPLPLRVSVPSVVSATDVIRALTLRVLADARPRSTNEPAGTP